MDLELEPFVSYSLSLTTTLPHGPAKIPPKKQRVTFRIGVHSIPVSFSCRREMISDIVRTWAKFTEGAQ